LLAKSSNLHDPSEFRPIALTNTIGKIFFAVIAKRLEKYMMVNDFISSVQKGFKAETPGCLEHSFAMYEALLNAKAHQKQIVVAWFDLCNAYGSVRHNLIQFALDWYHVPILIRELILNYYDKICAQIRTKDWTSDTFLFDIGLFQGCVLSCILFNCVFQLLLDMIGHLGEKNGYTFKGTQTILHDQAFADDLSLISSSPERMQSTITVLEMGLRWAHLRAKPQKCVCFALKKFDPRFEHKVDYERYGDTVYCPFDPNLTIAGQKLRFIINTEADPESLQSDHFKELGRWISADLTEDKMKLEIEKRLSADLGTIEESGVNGLCKLFLFEHFVVSRLSWVFLVHDLSVSFIKDLDKKVIPRLKSWAGLFRGSDLGTLFRRREHLGLQITSMLLCYKHMQLVKCCLLENSKDPLVREIYALKKEHVSAFTSRWTGPKALADLLPVAEHNLHFAGQVGRSGLGSNRAAPYIGSPTIRDLREKVVESLVSEFEEEHLRHASCLSRQGAWTHWRDLVRPFDLSWQNLVFSPPRVISFVLNAQINSVRTPDMLKLWGYSESAVCPLCDADPCTLHHILVNCDYALKQKRYNWRHDSVLANIEVALEKLLLGFNSKRPVSLVNATKQSFKASFVRKGESKPRENTRDALPLAVLDCANDWNIRVDFDRKQADFPASIFPTSLRPDIVLWSEMSRVVILLELTCCAEEGISRAQLRKETKYTELLGEINAGKVWKASLFTLEVGARGLVALSTQRVLKKIGFPPAQAARLCKTLSCVVARCSYAVYLAHKNLAWSHGGDLVVLEGRDEKKVLHECSREPSPETQPACIRVPDQKPDAKKNIRVLADNGIRSLYHFTDFSNLESIRTHGLLAWPKIEELKIQAKLGSSDLSHILDAKKGLANYVRLSFCRAHPMMFVARNKKRISRPVLLEIACEVVSRPGVLFCDINAAANDAKTSADPHVIRFDIVQAADHFSIKLGSRKFYQGEVLVPMCIPPHLIRIPDADMFGQPLVPGAKDITAKDENALARNFLSRTFTAERNLEVIGVSPSQPQPQVVPEEKSPFGSVTPEASMVKQAGICEMRMSGPTMPFSTPTLLLTAAGGASSTLSTPLTLLESAQPSRIDLELGAPPAVLDPKVPADLRLATPASVAGCETKVLVSEKINAACARGGVLNVKGDYNDCCYHLAGIIGTLCRNPNALFTGKTACSKTDLANARTKILENLSRWRKAQRDWCCSEAELDVYTRNFLGETVETFVTRASGKAKGTNRMGSNTDLALYTLYDNVQVVVVNARMIFRTSSEKALRQAVMTAGSGDQGAHDELGCTKSRFVCAILSENHYQLGVVKDPHIRAVFAEGNDWDEALLLILQYVRSRAPVHPGEKPLPLSAIWKDPCSPSKR
jgi:hypothetical protein